jgi:putative spermidine/putrescine transport system substrate-binding protein
VDFSIPMKRLRNILAFAALLFLISCGSQTVDESQQNAAKDWESIVNDAKGQTLTMMMWQGDPYINKYMNGYVIPELKQQFEITLNLVPGQGNDIVSLMMSELEAGQGESSVDMGWINGETFFQLRQIEGLYGPFAKDLPNSQFIDWDNPFIGTDFQQKVDGFECPWGNVQEALIYNSEFVSYPPQTLENLEAWVKENPGKFTIGSDFTGMTFLKAMLSDFAGGKEALAGEFDEKLYAESSQKLWDYLNRIKVNQD